MNIVFKKILGDPQAKTVKRLRKRVVAINALADKYKKMSDKELREQSDVLKKRLKKNHLTLFCQMPLQLLVKQLLEASVSATLMCNLLAVWCCMRAMLQR